MTPLGIACVAFVVAAAASHACVEIIMLDREIVRRRRLAHAGAPLGMFKGWRRASRASNTEQPS